MKTVGQPTIGYSDDSTVQTGRVLQALVTLYFSVAGSCPRVARSPVAFVVGLVHYLVAGRQRLMVAESLSKALGPAHDNAQIKRHTRKAFVYFGNYLIDLAHLGKKVPPQRISQYRVKAQGMENLEKALESGRPLVFAGLHFGNWDVGLEFLTSLLHNRPVVGVVSPMRYTVLRKRIDNRSQGNYREVIGGRRGLATALRVLKEGGVVVTMLDGPGSEVMRLPTRFLSGTALLSALPLRLAQKSGALLIPIASAYLRRSEFAAFVGMPVEVPEVADKEVLADSMQAIVTQLEPWVQKYPAQWYCFHRLWQQDSGYDDALSKRSRKISRGTVVRP